MNILEALTQMRDDLKTWVTNNLNAINSKIDEKTIPIDNELSAESTNPVQNKVIQEKIDEINTLIGDEPVADQISAAIASQNHFSGDYNDLTNAPNIVENENGNMVISDETGNIILKVDADGIHSTSLSLDGVNIQSLLDGKVNKEDGKGLSSNDFTDEDKAKLALINSDSASTSLDSELSLTSENPVKNKVITAAIQNHVSDKSLHITSYNDLLDTPGIIEDESGNMAIVDQNSNIIARIDGNGVHSVGLTINNEDLLEKIDNRLKEMSQSIVPVSIELNKTGELYNYGGFIDFHYHDANGVETGSKDYSSRIIEAKEGLIYVNNVAFDINDQSVIAGTIYSNGARVLNTNDIFYSPIDLTAGTSALATGKLYIVYE